MGLAWEEVEDGEFYEVHFDGERRYTFANRHCSDDACVVSLDRSVIEVESTEVTVRTVIGDERSADSPSARIQRPDPPERDDPPPAASVTRQGSEPTDAPHAERLEPEEGESVEELIERLEDELADDDEVVSIEPDGRVDPLGAGPDADPLARDRADLEPLALEDGSVEPLTSDERSPPNGEDDADWAARDLGLPDLSATATGEGVTVALVELGDVDRDHPELQRMGPVEGVTGGGTSDESSDTSRHATAVAGALLGTDSAAGVAPAADVRLYDIDVSTPTDVALTNAITHAVRDGADVINLSVSSTSQQHHGIQQAINLARSEGVLVVAGTGNHADDGCDTREGREHGDPTMPAAAEGVMRVGASTANGQRWHCSVGFDDEVLAPGADIPVLDEGSRAWWLVGPMRYEPRWGTGTSYAAPTVAGLAALLLELDPTLSHERLEAAVRATLSDDGVIDPTLALALHDPDATALSIGVHESDAYRGGGLYFSLTAVTDGTRLVGTGQLYHNVRSIVPEQSFVCRDEPESRYRIDQTVTVAGEMSGRGDDAEVAVEFAPSDPQIIDFASCRDEGYRAGWFEHAERATGAIAGARVETRLGSSDEDGDVVAGVYEGRCEPIGARTGGGCETPSAQPTRQELLSEADRPIPDHDRP